MYVRVLMLLHVFQSPRPVYMVMIELFKLLRLPPTQKIRKIIKILEFLETECGESGDITGSCLPPAALSCDTFYIEGLCRHLTELYPADAAITSAVNAYLSSADSAPYTTTNYRTLFNTLRHALYRQSGVQPSEWDLIAPGMRYGTQTATQLNSPAVRPFYAGMYVYAEDIRAPFNLGSIFRTAEAFGVEKLFLSEHCVSPEQSRTQRSAMGCTDFLPWERCPLTSLPNRYPIFALETGGTPITDFNFPPQGILLLGSEELGLSAGALRAASAGIVSIPMKGIKASLNVAVAFGIVMQYWIANRNSCVR